jgi:signal transduction histidine kinase
MGASALAEKIAEETRRGNLTLNASPKPVVLVVDDENGPRQALRMLLKEDYAVLLAPDVPSALAIIKEETIDLIITDIRMPRQSGVDLLRMVKQQNPDIQVIILTGYGQLETATRAVEYGAFAYLEKPFDNEKMLGYVAAALERHIQEKERRSLEYLALEANRFETLGRVVSGMMHDLGTPLSVLGSSIELLMLNPDREDLESRLQMMQNQVKHCNDLFRSTMGFLRNQSGESTPFCLNDMIQSCLQVAQPALRKQMVRVQCDLQERTPVCRGDMVLMRQALLNLITNACHAMEGQEDPQELRITTSVENGEVCLSVRDTGPGVPEFIRHQIFETFFTTKGEKGTGLGLAVVKHVMRRHGGSVRLVQSSGRGAEFIIRFPAETPQA